MTSLVLSLFPGIGLLDRGFEDEGFCVVRGPDLLWGGDVKKFHAPAGRFDGVIGGPPCQAFSSLRHMVKAQGFKIAENLIPEFERVAGEASPEWFVMENVPDAPLPVVSVFVVKPLVFNNRWAPDPPEGNVGAIQNRVRRFCFGTRDGRSLLPHPALFEHSAWEPAVLAGNQRACAVLMGGNGKPKKTSAGKVIRKPCAPTRRTFEESCKLQGLPEGFDLPPFTAEAKTRAVGNGVPYPLARAVARAVREAMEGMGT